MLLPDTHDVWSPYDTCAAAEASYSTWKAMPRASTLQQWQWKPAAAPDGALAANVPSSLPISRELGRQWQIPAAPASSAAQQATASSTTQPLSLLQLALLVETQPVAPAEAPTPWQQPSAISFRRQQSGLRWDAMLRTVTGHRYPEQVHATWHHMQCNAARLAPAQQECQQIVCTPAEKQLRPFAEQRRSAASPAVVTPSSQLEVCNMPGPAAAAAAAAVAAAAAACRQQSMLLVKAPADNAMPVTGITDGSGCGAATGDAMSGRWLPAAASDACNEPRAVVKPSSFLLPPAHRSAYTAVLLCSMS
jgi:hypothetical protein